MHGMARIIIGICRSNVAAGRQLTRFVVVHKKRLVLITAVYVIILYAVYGLYSSQRSRATDAKSGLLESVVGGALIRSWSALAQLNSRESSSLSLLEDETFEVPEGKLIIAIGW